MRLDPLGTIIMTPSRYLTIIEAAERSGLSAAYLYPMLRSGRIKARKFGRKWRIMASSLDHFMATRRPRGRQPKRRRKPVGLIEH